MKKFKSILLGLFSLLFIVGAKAQTANADYFAGKWSVLVKGLPDGDTKMFFILEKKDTTMTGVVQDSTGTQISKIDKVELNGNTATVYFSAQGYDVNLAMTKKDDDHITGSLMGMFDAEGERVKVAKYAHANFYFHHFLIAQRFFYEIISFTPCSAVCGSFYFP